MTARLSFGDSNTDLIVIEDFPQNLQFLAEDETAFDSRTLQLLRQRFDFYLSPINDDHPLFLDLWNRFCQEVRKIFFHRNNDD